MNILAKNCGSDAASPTVSANQKTRSRARSSAIAIQTEDAR
jgi:hypothetical protein